MSDDKFIQTTQPNSALRPLRDLCALCVQRSKPAAQTIPHSSINPVPPVNSRGTHTVRNKPKGWLLAPLMNKFFVQRDVQNIFRYRFRKLEAYFPPRD